MLCVYIAWIAEYDRYYKIDEGDLSLQKQTGVGLRKV